MAMSFFSPTTTPSSSASLLPIRRQCATGPSVSFPLKPHRFRVHLKPLRSSRIRTLSTSSLKIPTESILSSVVSTSRTLLFVLVAGLLSLSGVRSLPALACAPAPTQQPQETEEQESKEKKQQEEAGERKEDVLPQLDEEDAEDDEVRMYSAILSRNSGDVDALKCALYAKMRRADWGGALRFARLLRDAEPSELEWRLMVAQLHELKGDLAEAERHFRELLAEEPLLVRALHVGIACIVFLIYSVPAICLQFFVFLWLLLAPQLML